MEALVEIGDAGQLVGLQRGQELLADGFFYGREFVNDEDLNAQALRWLEGTANVRRHGTTGERPVDRFERDEQGALGPLAGRPYRRLGMSQPPTPTPRSRPAVQVEKRSVDRVVVPTRGAHRSLR